MFIVIMIALLWLVLSGFIYFIVRNKKVRLSGVQILLFYGCKIAGGAVYGYIFKRYYQGDDTWGLNHDGWLQYKRLLESPTLFITELFTSQPFYQDSSFYFHPFGYFENLEYSLITKLIALFNFISQGNYYINIVLFNFVGFWGLFFLYKLIAGELNPRKQQLVAAVIFLFPPAIFWLSGIRAEGLLLLFTGVLLYSFNQLVRLPKMKTLLLCFGCFAMIFIIRNGFAAMLIPALTGWALSFYYRKEPKRVFAVVYLTTVVAVVGGSFVLPEKYNLLAIIAGRQKDFFSLTGNTRFNLSPLGNNVLTFINVLPEALLNTFIRPFLWEAKGMLQWFSAVESLTVLIVAIITAYRWSSNRHAAINPFAWVLLLTALTNYLLIGFVVPFPGAIVRYRIIPEMLLVCGCLSFLLRDKTAKNYLTTASAQI